MGYYEVYILEKLVHSGVILKNVSLIRNKYVDKHF